MGVPKVIQDIRDIQDTAVFPVDDQSELVPDINPVDADTLQGHPLDHFASKEYVSQTLHDYVSSVLNKTY